MKSYLIFIIKPKHLLLRYFARVSYLYSKHLSLQNVHSLVEFSVAISLLLGAVRVYSRCPPRSHYLRSNWSRGQRPWYSHTGTSTGRSRNRLHLPGKRVLPAGQRRKPPNRIQERQSELQCFKESLRKYSSLWVTFLSISAKISFVHKLFHRNQVSSEPITECGPCERLQQTVLKRWVVSKGV